MSKINEIEMPNFKPNEFPEDPNLYAHKDMLISLQETRTRLNKPIIISRANGSLARFGDGSSSSRHYAMNRYSDAIDFFPDCDPFEAFVVISSIGLWGGIGIYFDTELKGLKKVMFHCDKRRQPLIWFRNNGKYYYPYMDLFYQELYSRFSDYYNK